MIFEVNEKTKFHVDENLVSALDTLIYNLKKDWDFMIIITGDRMVRVGKSILAQQIAAYLAKRTNTPFNIDNVFFESNKIRAAAQKMPQYSVLIYDEGRESLSKSKSRTGMQEEMLDWFNECGQLNHIFIIVLPDFFELKEEIGVARSECLINVYRDEEKKEIDIYKDGVLRPIVKFTRGQFALYNRKAKQQLYDKVRKGGFKNYWAVSPKFQGRFTNTYTVDEEKYKAKKKECLTRFDERKKNSKENKKAQFSIYRLIHFIKTIDPMLSIRDIVEKSRLEYNYKYIMRMFGQLKKEQVEYEWKEEQLAALKKKKDFEMPI